MSPASPSLPSYSQLKWRKRKRDCNLNRQQKPRIGEEEEEDHVAAVANDDEADDDYLYSPASNRNTDSDVLLRQSEVFSDGGQRISDFPSVVRRTINQPHPSVVSIVAAERRHLSGSSASNEGAVSLPFLENISHGQLQALSSVLPDHPSLQPPDVDKTSSYVCTPPPLMEGKGLMKPFGTNQVIFVPMHSDWFSLSTVHRLERQVIPHFFSGKSAEHTPEKYVALRNKIVAKYMENPGRRLSYADCQGLVANNDLYDLSRIVRFLDHWGIINYLSSTSVHRGLRMAGSLLKEDANGELIVHTSPLRSIDSLILFDRPKCSLRLDDIALLSTSSSSKDSAFPLGDLDVRIRERLSDHSCSYCSRLLPNFFYQSQKEVETILCSECFNDAKFITGHSSLDFVRMNSKKDLTDVDGDIWTDQETLLLLEAVEKYNDNWNEIAEHVMTKSKAQCILHFLRLPMEADLLENIEVPQVEISPVSLEVQNGGFSCSNPSNHTETSELNSEDQFPFASSQNPIMSLVVFLASAVGPRVAATCASAALSVLTKEDPRLSSQSVRVEVGSLGVTPINADENIKDKATNIKGDATSLSLEHIKRAAKCGLSAAAIKAKLFADQEEREVQRLAANIINHQLKRTELKLKQFAEVETFLLKECEQVEKMRQRLSAERARMISAFFAPAASVGGALPASTGHVNPITPAMPTASSQVSLSSYGNNMPHPHIQFMQRQQMFPLGPPRLSSSPASQNAMFNSGVANNSNHQQIMRSSSGNNSSIG